MSTINTVHRPTGNSPPRSSNGIDLKRHWAGLSGDRCRGPEINMFRQQGHARLRKYSVTEAHRECDDLKAKQKAAQPVEGAHLEKKSLLFTYLVNLVYYCDFNNCISQASAEAVILAKD